MAVAIVGGYLVLLVVLLWTVRRLGLWLERNAPVRRSYHAPMHHKRRDDIC